MRTNNLPKLLCWMFIPMLCVALSACGKKGGKDNEPGISSATLEEATKVTQRGMSLKEIEAILGPGNETDKPGLGTIINWEGKDWKYEVVLDNRGNVTRSSFRGPPPSPKPR